MGWRSPLHELSIWERGTAPHLFRTRLRRWVRATRGARVQEAGEVHKECRRREGFVSGELAVQEATRRPLTPTVATTERSMAVDHRNSRESTKELCSSGEH